MLKDDPVIDQIRAARSLISARFNHDPKRIVEYYIKFQEKYKKRLVNLAEFEKADYQESSVLNEAV
jgi:hypothetical protein